MRTLNAATAALTSRVQRSDVVKALARRDVRAPLYLLVAAFWMNLDVSQTSWAGVATMLGATALALSPSAPSPARSSCCTSEDRFWVRRSCTR